MSYSVFGHGPQAKSRASVLSPPLVLMLTLLASQSAMARLDLGQWCELQTSSFQITSDLDEDSLKALELRLRQFEVAAIPFLPGTEVSNRSPLKIIVFSERHEFLQLTGKRKFAGFMQPSLQTNRMLVGPIRGDVVSTAQHEYAHYLLRNRLDISLPIWFDEGLATLLGNIRIDEKGALVGELPMGRMTKRLNANTTLVAGGQSPQQVLKTTLTTDNVESWSQYRINAFYDWTWLLVHYLYFGSSKDRDQMADFLQARDVSLTSYLGLSQRRLLHALQKYLYKQVPSELVALPPEAEIDATFTCLTDDQRDHLLASTVIRQNPDTARTLIEPLLNSSTDADVLVTLSRIELAQGDVAASLATAEQAVSIAPTSANAIINLADRRVQDCLFNVDEACRDNWREVTALYRASIRADPNRFDAVMGLGLSYLYTGRPGEAVNYLKVAYSKAPWASVINFYLGESYRLIGDSRAETYLTNARNWADIEIWRHLADKSLSLLDEADQQTQ